MALDKDVYRWIEHTGELELAIEAQDEAAIFAEALTAFAELVAEEARGDPARQEVALEAPDMSDLLADWLDELVYLAEVERFVPERLTNLEVNDGNLRATVEGHRGEPRPLVKAVTRHGLTLEAAGETWKARVVLDV